MIALLAQPWAWIAIAIALATSHGIAYMKGRDSRNGEIAGLQAAILSSNAIADELRKRDPIISERVVTVFRDRLVPIETFVASIPEYVEEVKREAPSCSLPPAFRLLHDSSATGSPSTGPARSADAAAEVPCDVAAETVARNYIAAREDQERLRALQEWIRQTGS